MNIDIQDVSVSRKTLVVSLDKSEVETVRQSVVAEIAKVASLPGFRAGKVPLNVVTKRFAKEIASELTSKVVNKAYGDALEQSKLNVFSVVDIKEGLIESGMSASITYTVDITPDFPLPSYKGLETQVLAVEVTDAEVDAAIQSIRAERAAFNTVERASSKGDYVKLSYEGKIGEQPVAELVPDRAVFGKAVQTWEEVDGEGGLLPGLGKEIGGMSKGDKKQITVSFPQDFHVTELAGKQASYDVEVLEVRERVLPEIDEAFLKGLQIDSLDTLRTRIGQQIKFRKEMANRDDQRKQIGEKLGTAVEFAVPESLIESESQALLSRFMEDNIRRGVAYEAFEKNKEKLVADARGAAGRTAKLRMILQRIAEQENIRLENADIERYIVNEARRTNQRPDQFAKELGKDQDRVRQMQLVLLLDKTLDFVVTQATVVPVPATA